MCVRVSRQGLLTVHVLKREVKGGSDIIEVSRRVVVHV